MMQQQEIVIRLQNLVKSYGQSLAVDGLSLEVCAGEIFGFLGPNGAGKTTTIRIMTGLTLPASGEVSINGHDVLNRSEMVKKQFGIVQQHLSLDRELTVLEILEFHARLHHISRKERQQRIEELIEYSELGEHAAKRVNELSGGLKRRLMIARALLHRPKVLFLDEPTVGLDARTRRRLWALIRRLNADGTTIFLTTHYIEEAEELCHRVGILNSGKLTALGCLEELRQRVGLITAEVMTQGKLSYHFFPDIDSANRHIGQLPPDSHAVLVRDSNLEDVFVELTGRQREGDRA